MTPGKLSTYSDLEVALMIIIGCYGNGQTRKNALGSRYATCQGIVETILATNKVPNGSGQADPEAIKKAVHKVFDEMIDDLSNDIGMEV